MSSQTCQKKLVSIKINVESRYQVRYEMFEDRRHIVAPVVFLVEGVHIGLDGVPTYYSAQALANAYWHWNGMPLPIYHPPEEEVTCNTPAYLQQHVVGRLFNVTFEEDKLRGEVWIDVDKCEEIDPQLLARVRAGQSIEVSTGFSAIEEAVQGVWNSEEYEREVKLMIPDHLAILPATAGACSVQDGCGIRANQKGGEEMPIEFKGYQVENLSVVVNAEGRPEFKAGDLVVPKDIGVHYLGRDVFVQNHLAEGMSFEEVHGALQREVDKMDGPQYIHFLRAVFDNECIYYAMAQMEGRPSKLYEQSYTIKEDGTAELTGEPREVVEKTSFVPVSNNQRKEKRNMAEKKKADCGGCGELIEKLIKNAAAPYEEDDREKLELFTEVQLSSMVGFYEATTPEPKGKKNEKKDDPPESKPEPKAKTLQEYIDDAPPEFRDAMVSMKNTYEENKNSLVEKIMNAKEGVFTKEELQAKSMDELKKLASFIPAEEGSDYSLNAGSTHLQNVNKEEPLGMPEMNLGQDKK